MADYCAIDVVKGWLPANVKLDDSTTDPPTAAFVTSDILPGITGQINTAIANGGATIPVTDANMVAFLEQFEAKEAVYQVMLIRSAPEKVPEYLEEWHDTFEAYLEQWAAGDLSVPGSTAGAVSRGTDVEPWFTRDAIF